MTQKNSSLTPHSTTGTPAPLKRTRHPRAHRGPYARVTPIWAALLLSCPLDLLISSLLNHSGSPLSSGLGSGYIGTRQLSPLFAELPLPLFSEIVALACATIVLICLDQHRVHTVVARLRALHKAELRSSSLLLSMLGIGGCLAVMLAKGASVVVTLGGSAAGSAGALPVLGILAVLVLVGYRIVRRITQQHQLDRALLIKNPWHHIQRWEDQLLIITLLPMVAARIIGVCGALTPLGTHHPLFYPACLASSAAFLLLLRPQRAHFIGTCMRCKQPVPIAVASFGSCLQCDARLRESFLRRQEHGAAGVKSSVG